MTQPFTGSCACGKITYECASDPIGMGNCFCRDCQRSSGTSHTSVLVVLTNSLSVRGETLRYYESLSDSGNKVMCGFCTNCGNPMFAKNQKHPQFTSIKAASLDRTELFSPLIDSWISSAPAWSIMDPGNQKFEREIQV